MGDTGMSDHKVKRYDVECDPVTMEPVVGLPTQSRNAVVLATDYDRDIAELEAERDDAIGHMEHYKKWNATLEAERDEYKRMMREEALGATKARDKVAELEADAALSLIAGEE